MNHCLLFAALIISSVVGLSGKRVDAHVSSVQEKKETDNGQANVIVSKKPSILGDKGAQEQELESALLLIGPQGRLKKAAKEALEINELVLVAWCNRTAMSYPIPTTTEALILWVHWKEKTGNDEFTIYYLERIPANFLERAPGHRERRLWKLGGDRIPFVEKSLSLASKPRIDQIADFISKTNFGNLEFRDDVVIGHVVAISQQKKIVDELAKTLTKNQRNEKYQRYIDGISSGPGIESRKKK